MADQNPAAALQETVNTVNSQIVNLNKVLSNYARNATKPGAAQTAQKQVENVSKKLASTPKPTEKKVEKSHKSEDTKKNAEDVRQESEYSVTDLWGDPRMNPYFLRVAEYFGVDQRDYSQASSKIEAIVRWAEKETKSKNIGDILRVIGQTSRKLQSPGFGEKRYAIMYRYVKLAQQRMGIQKEMEAYLDK